MRRRQVLDMKIVYSLAECLRLVVSFDSKTQPGVQPSEALLQELANVLFLGQLPGRNRNELVGFGVRAVFQEGLGFPC
jgi:hypothetical protein